MHVSVLRKAGCKEGRFEMEKNEEKEEDRYE